MINRTLQCIAVSFCLILPVLFSSCKKEEVQSATNNIKVSTFGPFDITFKSAFFGGKIEDYGSSPLLSFGVCWSKNPAPDTLLSTKTKTQYTQIGSDIFGSSINSLLPETTYYIRAYAVTGAGLFYGDEKSFTTKAMCVDSVVDVDGNVYKTVCIAEKCWMARNLTTGHFADGSAIANVGFNEWNSASTAVPSAYCVYDGLAANDSLYGKLYNWYAVHDPRKLCPSGWHVASDVEWDLLADSLGGVPVAGDKLKKVSGWWSSSNATPTDAIGFSALPGGSTSGRKGEYTVFWTSRSYGSGYAAVAELTYSSPYLEIGTGQMVGNGNSVRCVMD